MVILNQGDERGLLAALSLEDKVRLLTGADNWRTHQLPVIGLRPMVMSSYAVRRVLVSFRTGVRTRA